MNENKENEGKIPEIDKALDPKKASKKFKNKVSTSRDPHEAVRLQKPPKFNMKSMRERNNEPDGIRPISVTNASTSKVA